jgi:hypothetical protein
MTSFQKFGWFLVGAYVGMGWVYLNQWIGGAT